MGRVFCGAGQVLDLIEAKRKAEQILAQAVAVLQTLQSYASNAEKRYKDVAAKFEGMTGTDTEYYLRSTVDPIRAGSQKAKDDVAGAQAKENQAREALKGIDQRYPTDLQAIFQDAGAPYPGAADVPLTARRNNKEAGRSLAQVPPPCHLVWAGSPAQRKARLRGHRQ